ncbi:acyltransferase [Nocardiopsis rhodophaea]|uniref:acyltransferase n=1 Tax=Nocardiopsis rhodophaea TaxID=280238 RepID=UPI0031E34C29
MDVADNALIGEHCTLGCPKEARLRDYQSGGVPSAPGARVRIGNGCILMNQVILYEGVSLGDDCLVEDRVRIGYDTVVGARSRLVYGAYVCDRVTIGPESRVAGFVCDATFIGERCTVMGDLVHEYTRPHQGWWEVDEPAPTIVDDSVVGYGAHVIGGVTIGPRSYVAAGATVTRDVPPESVVVGVNNHTPVRDWPGERLSGLISQWTTARRR